MRGNLGRKHEEINKKREKRGAREHGEECEGEKKERRKGKKRTKWEKRRTGTGIEGNKGGGGTSDLSVH